MSVAQPDEINYRLMSVDEVKEAVHKAKLNCHDDEELKRRIRAATGYAGSFAVTSTSIGSGRMKMALFMIMMWGPDGEVLNL